MLDERVNDSSTVGSHLRHAAKKLKVSVESLLPVDEFGETAPFPDELSSTWRVFVELAAARGSNGFAPSPIQFSEILSWCLLSQIRLLPWEVEIIRRLDSVYLEVTHARLSRTQPSDSE